MSVGSWYVSRGRIDRRTYWLRYFLPLFVVYVVVQVVVVSVLGAAAPAPGTAGAGLSGTSTTGFVVLALVYLLTLTPQISSQVTRLHDRGHSAWWLLFNVLPLAGGIVLLVQFCLPGDGGPNRYGPPPAPRDVVPDPPYPTPAGS